jgi:hypothetical protein
MACVNHTSAAPSGSGGVPDERRPAAAQTGSVPWFLLHHQHAPADCTAAFAAWNGFASPLRHEPAACSCLTGGHAVWWTVEAPDVGTALALVPPFVRARTRAVEVRDVEVP